MNTAPELITVIQLGRIGDLFHTLPTLRGLRETYPQARIRLICREAFSHFVKYELSVNEVISIDAGEWVAPFQKKKKLWKKEEFWAHLNQIREKVEEIREEDDCVINLTFSEFSGRLATLISQEILGIGNYNNQTVIEGFWSQYFVSTVLRTGINRFHITDIYKLISGVQGTKGNSLFDAGRFKAKAQGELQKLGIDLDKGKLITINIGALSPENRWPLKNYANLVGQFQRKYEGYTFIFTGDSEDRLAIEKAIKGRSRCINMAGLSDLDTFFGILAYSDLVMSNDLGPAQMAVGLGSPTLTITRGSVRFWESGPCEENHYVVRALEGVATVKAVSMVMDVQLKLSEANEESLTTTFKGDFNHRIYRSRKTGHNLVQYKQIAGVKEESVEGWFIYAYNWLRFEELSSTASFPATIKPAETTMSVSILDVLIQSFNKAYELADFGVKYGGLLKKEWRANDRSIEEIKILGTRLREVDATLRTLAESIPYLKPMLDEFEIEQLSLPLTDAYTTVELGVECYARLKDRFALMHNKSQSMREKMVEKIYGSEGNSEPPDEKKSQSAMEQVQNFRVTEVGI